MTRVLAVAECGSRPLPLIRQKHPVVLLLPQQGEQALSVQGSGRAGRFQKGLTSATAAGQSRRVSLSATMARHNCASTAGPLQPVCARALRKSVMLGPGHERSARYQARSKRGC